MEKSPYTQRNLTRRQWFKTAAALVAGAVTARLSANGTPSGVMKASAVVSAAVSDSGATVSAGNAADDRRKVSHIAHLQAVACSQCDACMPCGYGIDIPGNFLFYNSMLEKGEVPDIRTADPESSEFARKARHFLRRYDRTIPDRHQSQRCIRCFHCVSECRDGVFIVNELAALTELTDYLRDWECTH